MADIEQMHAHIIQVAAQKSGLPEEQVAVLYGGSVKAANAKDIMEARGVAGVLVGDASLKVERVLRNYSSLGCVRFIKV